jgi:hypothetical protein
VPLQIPALTRARAERDRARRDTARAQRQLHDRDTELAVARAEIERCRAALDETAASMAAAADLATDQTRVIETLRSELHEARESVVAATNIATEAIASNARYLNELDAVRRSDRVVGDLVKDRLLVFLRDSGGVFDGLLLDADDKTLTFGDVHRRGADGVSVTAAPGELYLERGRVLYMQRVSAEQTQAL